MIPLRINKKLKKQTEGTWLALTKRSLELERPQLSQEVADTLNFPVGNVDLVISTFLRRVVYHLGKGESVSFLNDGLGRLEVIDGKARRVWAPRDQAKFINIPAQWRVRFRTSKELDAQLKRASQEVL